ncbi:transposase [Anthropogastromicrobium aceti]|uniref:DDE-type integrase/transposase/recombinase n=2 Tax=Anthropogastromicrobium aceti TaxID=2981768 RepID=A0AAE3E2R1_9FIRM|nr:DDE-type integrase/transposase/recombinase [Anthropogastromicrobium aceti]
MQRVLLANGLISIRSAVASLNSDCINTDLAINTLKTAIKKEKHPKVILHSDQGVQFTSCEFVNFCKDNNITQSMSKAGCPYDNAPMERFYNTFKSNFYNVTSFSNVDVTKKIDQYKHLPIMKKYCHQYFTFLNRI